MKIPILCCLTLSLIYECFGQLPNNPIINRPILRFMNRGVNNVVPVRQQPMPMNIPRRIIQFLPVPVVKKVTHHHVHHVIAHKGVAKSKYQSDNGFDFDNKDNENNSNSNDNSKNFRDEIGSNSDFNDNGFKSDFSKRGGRVLPSGTVTTLGDLIKSTGGGKSAIRGVIGGQKAEFVPIVVGILDDGADKDKDKEFSLRSGLIRPDVKKRYLPPKETLKLFEDLARLGFK